MVAITVVPTAVACTEVIEELMSHTMAEVIAEVIGEVIGAAHVFRTMAVRAWADAAAASRSDVQLKHDLMPLGHLQNGIPFYRFAYIGSDVAYVGVMAQDVQKVDPRAVTSGSDGYLRVHYERLGLKFQTYKNGWSAAVPYPPAECIDSAGTN